MTFQVGLTRTRKRMIHWKFSGPYNEELLIAMWNRRTGLFDGTLLVRKEGSTSSLGKPCYWSNVTIEVMTRRLGLPHHLQSHVRIQLRFPLPKPYCKDVFLLRPIAFLIPEKDRKSKVILFLFHSHLLICFQSELLPQFLLLVIWLGSSPLSTGKYREWLAVD